MYADGWARPRSRFSSFWRSIFLLLGHLVATALVFVALFTLGWWVSWVFNYLNAIRKFPAPILIVLTHLEIGLVYIDAGVSGCVLLAGIIRFVLDVWKGD